MAKDVLYIIPEGSVDAACFAEAERQNENILFTSVNSFAPLDQIADSLTAKDIKVAAARGYVATLIRVNYPNLALVELPVTAYDVLRAFPRDFGGPVAVVTVGLKVIGLELISQTAGVEIRDYTCTPFEKLRDAIQDAVDKGVKLVVGGTLTLRIVAKSFPQVQGALLPLGPETIEQSLNEIRQMHRAITRKIDELSFPMKTIDALAEGVIDVRSGIVRMANTAAGEFLGIGDGASLRGRPVDVLPKEVREWSEDEDFDNMKVATVRGQSVLVRRHYRDRSGNSYILTLHSKEVLEDMESQVRTKTFTRKDAAHYTFADIFGTSRKLAHAVKLANVYAQSDSNILISGESGCGKEVFAQSIHYASARRNKPFVAVNCGAFTKELIMSELFGYVEGSFTGASRKGKAGIFEVAHGGTVFLDEISEMDYSLQAMLLRVLQEGCVVRLGSHKIIPVDIRIIAATNRNLQARVASGEFRLDLFYRLNVLPLQIPPMREREGDILPLLQFFIRRLAGPSNPIKYSFSAEAQALVNSYSWPGNVREIGNVAQRIVATCSAGEIAGEDLAELMQLDQAGLQTLGGLAAGGSGSLVQSQYSEIASAMEQAGGRLGDAAKILGINRTTLWRRMKKMGIKARG
ncbi:MAG: sigma 54-interacting transcriptional regulator [Desulfovibrio sp.]|nr:sigma 54-interacting transcriptional regulator [Desulfovibrio sp.]MBR5049858.1 sigma 54-interacting transcriptional regulator [Desulfovibrio sp.]